jgi:hypothetical protein
VVRFFFVREASMGSNSSSSNAYDLSSTPASFLQRSAKISDRDERDQGVYRGVKTEARKMSNGRGKGKKRRLLRLRSGLERRRGTGDERSSSCLESDLGLLDVKLGLALDVGEVDGEAGDERKRTREER